MGIELDPRYQEEAYREVRQSLNKHLGKGTYLKNAQEIEEWCKNTREGKKVWKIRLPSTIAKDEYEKQLGQKLSTIRFNVLKKYEGQALEEIEDEEDRRIVEIIRNLDKEYGIKTHLKNALEIEDWCKNVFAGKKVWERRLPISVSKDEYEKQLGQKLITIRLNVLKKYEGQALEEI